MNRFFWQLKVRCGVPMPRLAPLLPASGVMVSCLSAVLVSAAAGAQMPSLGADQLQTQPRSVLQPDGQVVPVQSTLNEAAGPLRVRTQPPPRDPLIPDFIPSELLTPSAPRPIDPISEFKVPPLDGGIKVRIGQ